MSDRSKEMQHLFGKELEARALEKLAREKIAPREAHEAAITAVVDMLRKSGYFKDTDVVEAAFPDATDGSLAKWLSKGELPAGMGKAVARYDVTSVVVDGPSAADQFAPALEASGYKLDIYPNMDKMDGDHDSVSYYVYEAAE